jgi:hypothetical protein
MSRRRTNSLWTCDTHVTWVRLAHAPETVFAYPRQRIPRHGPRLLHGIRWIKVSSRPLVRSQHHSMLDFTCTTRSLSLFRCVSQNVSGEARLSCSIFECSTSDAGRSLLSPCALIGEPQPSELKRPQTLRIARPCRGHPIEGLKTIPYGYAQLNSIASMLSSVL